MPLTDNNFYAALEPYLEMLEARENTASLIDWMALVQMTKDRIINAPGQYLSDAHQSADELKRSITEIFTERFPKAFTKQDEPVEENVLS